MQVKSRERVANHGEVYTSEREVNAMLDLVADQVTDIDKTFLEPACGTGNFLAVILERRLNTLAKKHKKVQYNFEKSALTAVATLYGIELLPDNVAECRERLLAIFVKHYHTLFPKTYKSACIDSAAYILSKNILCGDALTLTTADGAPIVFSRWQWLGSQVVRHDFRYAHLLERAQSSHGDDMFAQTDKPSHFIPRAIKQYRPVHFLELNDDGFI